MTKSVFGLVIYIAILLTFPIFIVVDNQKDLVNNQKNIVNNQAKIYARLDSIQNNIGK